MLICSFEKDRSKNSTQQKLFPPAYEDFREIIRKIFIRDYPGENQAFSMFYKINETHNFVLNQETYNECLKNFNKKFFKTLFYIPENLNCSVRPSSLRVHRGFKKEENDQKVKEKDQKIETKPEINNEEIAPTSKKIEENKEEEITNSHKKKINYQKPDIIRETFEENQSECTDYNSKKLPDPYNISESIKKLENENDDENEKNDYEENLPEPIFKKKLFFDSEPVQSEIIYANDLQNNEDNKQEKNNFEAIKSIVWLEINKKIPDIMNEIGQCLKKKNDKKKEKVVQMSNYFFQNEESIFFFFLIFYFFFFFSFLYPR